VLAARFRYVDPATSLPISWVGPYGRLTNLEHYFWPKIAADYNWLFGVQTAGRAPGLEFWRPWVYIESGYTWALWTGGLPLLLAVIALVALAVRTGIRLVRSSRPAAGAMGIAVTTLACSLAVLMFFDPHLTFRGGGEIVFVLLALAANLDVGRPVAEREPPQAGSRDLPEAVDGNGIRTHGWEHVRGRHRHNAATPRSWGAPLPSVPDGGAK
jgi:hypothetical protein